ncbi:2'-O-glycosyltransferase CruG [Gloeocapsa sp. PCC 73106]|uniref:2'-O-glycosyltransferase CruG n=1 Tax=Gloeocapsa sp. PCC 73106 TaxID=102232 RepID=UPI0002AC92C0|nr:glycosyltransferase family 2 protein [Gloeocapsa sp. PCC 73106]ELR96832.1 glycosyl transferase [Gloeocapsa sp. PCC 73106]
MESLTQTTVGAICLILLLSQGSATLILLSRLLPGARRKPPLVPMDPTPEQLGAVSVIVPTLNEAARVDPCLRGLSHQSYEVREIIFVDSKSQDGTPEKVKTAQISDPRFRLFNDPPLPQGWVGRPWALHNGFLYSSTHSKWILGIDADTIPQPGLVASLISTAEQEGYDVISLAPQFILKYPGEWWLQPALLITLLYRCSSPGSGNSLPERIMANGQCFLCRREVLAAVEGYQSAASSFCDDVTLARYLATRGYNVGFGDGANLIKVRMYEGLKETWQEWGRSLDLKDATSPLSLWSDLWLLFNVQALPLLLLLVTGWLLSQGITFLTIKAVFALNLGLLVLRFTLTFATAGSYANLSLFNPSSWLFWLSPLADPVAWFRIWLSARQTPRQWRGRSY